VESPFLRRPARIWRIVLGVILVLWSVGSIAAIGGRAAVEPVTHGDVAGGIGSLIGLGIMIALGIWGVLLIRAGLPKSGQPR
jgi:hypothetical protein